MTDTDLRRLAEAHGIQLEFSAIGGQPATLGDETLVALLAAMDVPAGSPEEIAAAFARLEEERRRPLPPTIVATHGHAWRLPDGLRDVVVTLEDGTELVVDAADELPADLPLGWHTLRASAAGRTDVTATVICAPERLPEPARSWGLQVQLYALRSERSWGIGDAADLSHLVHVAGTELGADAVLVNPLHSPTPREPLQNSPYYPSSRRWYDPLLIAVEHTPEYAAADAGLRAAVDAIGARLGGGATADRIVRDDVWAAKRAALELLFPARRREVLDGYRAEHGEELDRFATYCALVERHGHNWLEWPEQLRRPDAPAALQARVDLAERVEFWAWTQLLCSEQLRAAQEVARAHDMGIGLIHDLAVGVDPAGADGWALQDVLALGASAGAPPDPFSQLGQDWGVPPWHPRRIAEAGYAPLRDMLRAVLCNGGGIRIDHVMGLWRLWWVPRGGKPSEGGYVHYDAEAMIAAVTLEAHRAGAIVVGEDLGTVEPRVREAMDARGWLGSEVLWFTRDGSHFTAPSGYRRRAVASISTHDLPTAAGFLTGEHVRVRADLDQLAQSREDAEREWYDDRRGLLDALRREGLLDGVDEGDVDGLVAAMHEFLARTPCALVLASPYDMVGDPRQPNLPGTLDEYPNWRLPLATPDGRGGTRPVLLDELLGDPRVRRVAATLASRAGVAGLR